LVVFLLLIIPFIARAKMVFIDGAFAPAKRAFVHLDGALSIAGMALGI